MVLKQNPPKYLAYIKEANSRQPFPGTYECTDVDWGHELVFVKRLPFTEPCVFGFNEVVLREYSGRPDLNKKPVYTDDIVRLNRRSNKPLVGVVKFSPELAAFIVDVRCFTDSRDHLEFLLSDPNTESCEILGNLHEHPELLPKATTV